MDHYLKTLAPEQLVINGYDLWPIKRYNVAPTTRGEIIRPMEDGMSVDKVRWGWSPFWAKGEGKSPAPVNASVETRLTWKYLRPDLGERPGTSLGQQLAEWVKDPNDPKLKQHYFVRLNEEGPTFFAALTENASGERSCQQKIRSRILGHLS